ncbi:MarC family protein [Falsiroseomonas sp. HW251]|uniref:MarC family protein n=1 Tax=Falsiroseomonas sp. HW251 TaxID=3390998 RepID=UPI003D31C60A
MDSARQLSDIGWKQMFMLLFLMLGPIKILMPFVRLTRGLEAAARRNMATRAILASAAALVVAGALGRSTMDNFNMSPNVLALTGGLVLFLVALKTVMEQFAATPPAAPQPAEVPAGDARRLAMNPLAFPTIVTPYGIAATIVFVALAEDMASKLMVGGVVMAILAVDWLAMIYAHAILRWLGTPLQILGVVLGVTQVGIGLQVMLRSLSELGVFALRSG